MAAGAARRAAATALLTLLVAIGLGQAPVQAAPAPLQVEISSLAPLLLRPTQALTLTVRVTNAGPAAAPLGDLRLALAAPTLTEPSHVDDWLAGNRSDGVLRPLTTARAPATVVPGATANVVLSVPRATDYAPQAYGLLPLVVTAGGTRTRTFAAYQRGKEYEPLSVSVLLPLTLEPLPELWSRNREAREGAWTQQLGPDSRLRALLEGGAGREVTYAVDPTLLTSADARSEAEATVRDGFTQVLTEAVRGHEPVILPEADADLAALAPLRDAVPHAAAAVRRAQELATSLGGRADVLWPGGALTRGAVPALRTLYAAGTTPVLLLTSPTAPRPSVYAPASVSGLPALRGADPLTAAVVEASRSDAGIAQRQALIAQTVVALNQLPGTRRSALIVPERGVTLDAARMAAALDVLAALPWITPTPLRQTLSAAASEQAPAAVLPAVLPADPRAEQPVLTAVRERTIRAAADSVTPTAAVREDGANLIGQWREEAQQSLSVRWRGHLTAWNTLVAPLVADAATARSSLRIVMQDVTFAADKGRLSVTVANDLDVEVRGVTLSLRADSPRLRLEKASAPDLRIGARSKAVVAFDATALAAGDVQLTAELTDPTGGAVAQPQTATIALSPTGGWVYWVIAAIAALALVIGIWRTVRSPRKAPA